MDDIIADQDVLWAIRSAGTRGEEGKRRADLVQVLTSAINEKQPKRKQPFPSPTEYYVAALSTLATNLSSKQHEDLSTVNADLLYLLSKVIPHLSVGVARLDADAAFASILAATGKSSNLGARSGLAALAGLLTAQAKETWNKPIVVKSFKALLSKVVDDNPKVRRAAQDSVLIVLNKSPATQQVLTMIQEYLKSSVESTGTAERTLLKVLYFARLIAPQFVSQKKLLSECRESIVALIERSIKTEVLSQALKALVEYCPSEDEIDSEEDVIRSIIERLIKCFKFSKFPVEPWAETLANLASKARASRDVAGQALLQVLKDEQLNEAETETVGRALNAIISSESVSSEEARNLADSFLNIGLHAQAQRVWSIILPSLALIIDSKLDEDDDLTIIRSIAKKSVEARESLVDWKSGEEKTDAPWKRTIEYVITACAGKMGPDNFMQAIPLSISKTDQNLNPARLCLLKPLKEAWRNPSNNLVRLATFRGTILKLAKFSEDSASQAESQGLPQNAKMFHTRTLQLWGLLPAFCSGASDVAESFPPMAKMLASALQDDKTPELAPLVAQSLLALIKAVLGFDVYNNSSAQQGDRNYDSDLLHSRFGGKSTAFLGRSRKGSMRTSHAAEGDEEEDEDDDEDDEDKDDEEEEALKTTKVTTNPSEQQKRVRSKEERETDLAALRKLAPQFLPLLFNHYDAAYRMGDQGNTRAQALFEAIEAFCRVAEPKYLGTLLRQLVQKFLVAVNNDDFATGKVLLAIGSALAPGMSEEEANTMLKALRPHLTESDGTDEGLQKRAFVCLMRMLKAPNLSEWLAAQKEDIMDLLQQSLVVDVKASVKATRLLCLRRLLIQSDGLEEGESSFRVRDLSAELLGEVLLSLKESNSQTREAGFDLFTDMALKMDEQENAIGDFFQMAIAGLAATTPHMRSCTILAVCRLIALFGSRADCSQMCAEASVACMQLFQEKSREVVRSLITLCKVCAIKLEIPVLNDVVLPHLLRGILPWSLDTRNRFSLKIRVVFDKLVKRLGLDAILEKRIIPADHRLLVYIKRQNTQKRNRKEASAEGDRKRKQSGDGDDVVISHRGGADPINLLDPSSLASISKRRRRDEDDDDDEDDFKRDADGRIIIPDDDAEKEAAELAKSRKRVRASSQADEGDDDEEDDESDGDEQEKTEAQTKHRKKKKKQPEQQFGKEFKAKKAGGDAKYKGMKTDPYAYIPLDHRMLNKRKKHQAVKRFVGVGRGTKKGYRNRSGSAA